ncbi:MAG: SEC-C metal-binding domain-containing protein, partial [Aggregatilineales bacterium]
VSKSIEQAQVRVEGHNFDIRKRVLDYDDVVNRQREIIYEKRREWLEDPAEDVHEKYFAVVEEQVLGVVQIYTGELEYIPDDDVELFYKDLLKVFPVPEDYNIDTLREMSREELEDGLVQAAREAFERKHEELEAAQDGLMAKAERLTMLRAVDTYWQRHLTGLDILREGIGLVGFAQKDPLVEYQREGFAMFERLQDDIDEQASRMIFMTQPVRVDNQPRRQMRTGRGNQGGEKVKQETVRKVNKLGRNDLCHCGSGKKYKQCHMKSDRAEERERARAHRN